MTCGSVNAAWLSIQENGPRHLQDAANEQAHQELQAQLQQQTGAAAVEFEVRQQQTQRM